MALVLRSDGDRSWDGLFELGLYILFMLVTPSMLICCLLYNVSSINAQN